MVASGYREGFIGEKVFRLSRDQINQSKNNSLSNDLYVTDVGYFPSAVNHLVERETPSSEAILIYCTRGDGWVEFCEETTVISSGQFFVIPPLEPHRYGSSSGWQIYWVHFGGGRAPIVTSQIGDSGSGHLPGAEAEEAIQLFERMIGRAENGLTMDSVNYLHFALWHLLGLFVVRANRSPVSGDCTVRIAAAIEFMKGRLADRLSLDEMAEHAGYSVSHFTQLFRSHTGYAPIDFYLQLKIQHASKLLSTTQMKVSDISDACGYENPYYFSRLFRKIAGCSPRDYRRQYRV